MAALLEALWEAIDRFALVPPRLEPYATRMPTEPLPQLIVLPCPTCGEEAIVQLSLVVELEGEVRLQSRVVQQCGCGSAG